MHALLTSQYLAALAMLRNAMVACPDELWAGTQDTNQFWRIAYHALFYVDFYLSPSEEAFVPWEHGIIDANFMSAELPARADGLPPYNTRAELLAYADTIAAGLRERLAADPLEQYSGFEWISFSRTELHVYSIRHAQHHAGQLTERLAANGHRGATWIGLVRPTGELVR